MAKDPAFLFYPGDYLRDTQNLSEKSQVAYDRIMCEHMRNICEDMIFITVSKMKVNFFTKRLNDEEKDELLFVLKKIGDDFQIEWVAESIAKRKLYSDSRSKNRAVKNKKHMLTYVEHMENENENENVNIIEDKNIYIYNKFYDSEISKISKSDDELKNYQYLLNELFGKNDSNLVYSNVLKLKPISFIQFKKLRIIAGENNRQIIDTIKALENKKDSSKKYTSLYLTLNNWLKIR